MPISNPFKSCTNSTIILQVQPNMHLEFPNVFPHPLLSSYFSKKDLI